MSLDAADFNILPTVVGDDDCRVLITHRWSGKTWRWRGKEKDWPAARQKLLAKIDAELNPENDNKLAIIGAAPTP